MEVKHAKPLRPQPRSTLKQEIITDENSQSEMKPSSERPRRREWEGVNRAMEVVKRQQEEAMVSAIIARVKMECALEGEDCSRRGYQKH